MSIGGRKTTQKRIIKEQKASSRYENEGSIGKSFVIDEIKVRKI